MIFQKDLESVFENRQIWGSFDFGAQLVPNTNSAIRKATLSIRCLISWDLKICFSTL